jgi:diguanylate cyclase (GGDEF)-like protein
MKSSYAPFLTFSLALYLVLLCASQGNSQSAGANAEKAPGDTDLIFLGNHQLPPMSSIQEGKPVGVIVDLARALQKRIPHNVRVEFINWSQAQQLVLNGAADALLHINPSENRKHIFDFSDPLLESEFCIFMSTQHFKKELSRLQGFRIGVEKAGLPEEILPNNCLTDIVIIPTLQQGFEMLENGSLDIMIADRWTGSYILAVNKMEEIFIYGTVDQNNSAIAVKKGNAGLLSDINKALAEIKKDGTYARIMRKWEPKKIVFQTKEEIFKQKIVFISLITIIILVILIIIILIVEINKRKKFNEKLKEYSTKDSLTGLLNRRSIKSIIESEIYRKKRYDTPTSLLLVDIDFFKEINDQYGHAIGDNVLSTLAHIFRENTRKTDSIARWGGDEIAIVAANTTIEDAVLLAESIRKNVKAHAFEEIDHITLSIGVSEYSSNESYLEWYKRTDKALYEAKSKGRNRVCADYIHLNKKDCTHRDT